MKTSSSPYLPPAAVDLDLPDTVSLACAWARAQDASHPCPEMHLECGRLTCQRHLGVSYVVSQLLRLRRSGACVWLHRVNPQLRQCLQLLRLTPLFQFADDRLGALPKQ